MERSNLLGIFITVLICVLASAMPAAASMVSFQGTTPADGSTINDTNFSVNVTTGTGSTAYALLNFDNTLTLWYRMEKGDGTHFTDELGKLNASCVASYECPQYQTTGAFNGSYSFDGVNDTIDVPYSTAHSPTNEITISTWVYFNNTASGGSIVSKTEAGGYWLGHGGACGSGLCFYFKNATAYQYSGTDSTVVAGRWYHVVGTYNGSQLSLYINGTLRQSASVYGLITYTVNNNLCIGGEVGAATCSKSALLNGSIDEVIIMNRSISSTEVAALYNSTQSSYFNSFRSLARGSTHTFKAYSVDLAGVLNSSSLYTVNIESNLVFGSNFSNYPHFWAKQDRILPMNITCTNYSHADYNWYVDNIYNGTGKYFNFTAGNYLLGLHNVTARCNTSDMQINSTFKVEVLGLKDFLIVAVGDQHFSSTLWNGYGGNNLNDSFYWLKFMKNYVNVSFVFSTGDLTQGNSNDEWQIANNTFNILDNAGIPNAIALGNHDAGAGYEPLNRYAPFFNFTRYSGKSYYGGTLINTSGENNYFYVNESIPLMFVSGAWCKNYTLNWVNETIRNNPTRRTVFFVHDLLSEDSYLSTSTAYCSYTGADVWNLSLKSNPNVFLGMDGHYDGDVNRTYKGTNGNNVTMVMTAFHNTSANLGGNGKVRFYLFRYTQSQISSGVYSPRSNAYNSTAIYDRQYFYNMNDTYSPDVTLQSPGNGTSFTDTPITFNATAIDDFDLNNATLYIWDSTGQVVNTTTVSVSGTGDKASTNALLRSTGTYYWNYLVSDDSGNEDWAGQNLTLNYVASSATEDFEQTACENSSTAIGNLIGRFGLLFIIMIFGGVFYVFIYKTGLMSMAQLIFAGLMGLVILVILLMLVSDMTGVGC